MNCLYINLFFNIVAGIVQTVLKAVSVSPSHRSLPFEPCRDFFLYLIRIQDCDENPMFHLQSQCSPETHLLPVRSAWNFSAETILFVLWSSVKILGIQRAQNFLYLNFPVTASWIVVLDTSGMMWCNSLIVTRRFLRISPSISERRSSEIKDGLPLLCSSWTSVLPSENSRHHFVTFCRFITLP